MFQQLFSRRQIPYPLMGLYPVIAVHEPAHVILPVNTRLEYYLVAPPSQRMEVPPLPHDRSDKSLNLQIQPTTACYFTVAVIEVTRPYLFRCRGSLRNHRCAMFFSAADRAAEPEKYELFSEFDSCESRLLSPLPKLHGITRYLFQRY